jgi:hypothetical protein
MIAEIQMKIQKLQTRKSHSDGSSNISVPFFVGQVQSSRHGGAGPPPSRMSGALLGPVAYRSVRR